MRQDELLLLVDAVSRFDHDDRRWLTDIADTLRSLRPKASTAISMGYRVIDDRVQALALSAPDTAAFVDLTQRGLCELAPSRRRELFGSPACAITAMQAFGGQVSGELQHDLATHGARDLLAMMACVDSSDGVLIATMESDRVDEQVAAQLSPVAMQLHTTWRLRRALSGTRLEDVASAVFADSGRCEQAGSLSDADVKAVGERVRTRSGARMRAVAGDAQAMLAWSELSAGRLMLVDQIDRDGQRVVVVVPCEDSASLRALTGVEERIARLAGQALSNKEIAHTLKLSESAIENHLCRALRKLRLRDRVALARLYTQLEAMQVDRQRAQLRSAS